MPSTAMQQKRIAAPPRPYAFHERPFRIVQIIAAILIALSVYVLITTPQEFGSFNYMFGFFSLVFFITCILWSSIVAYTVPLFTLSPQGLLCHALGKSIPWSDISSWSEGMVYLGKRGTFHELVFVLQGTSSLLRPRKVSRNRVESKEGYDTVVNPETGKRSRLPALRTRLVFRFAHFPRNLEKEQLFMLLEHYKACAENGPSSE